MFPIGFEKVHISRNLKICLSVVSTTVFIRPRRFNNRLQDGCHDEFEWGSDAADNTIAQPATNEYGSRKRKILGGI